MKKSLIIILIISNCSLIFGQNADELNEQSKNLINSQEYEKALPLLRKSAELGNAEAQYNLGYMYEAGIVVQQNSEISVQWYYESASNGWNNGIYKMMMAYGTGKGVELNFGLAFKYALECANNNDSTCMFNLVTCYKDGRGTKKDIVKMLEWAERLGKFENPRNLAKSGYITSARLSLAQMYRTGDDLQQDYYKSYLWYLIYNESKIDFSYFQQQSIVKEIQEIEKNLTPEQIKIAPQDAEKLLERPLKNLENLYKAQT